MASKKIWVTISLAEPMNFSSGEYFIHWKVLKTQNLKLSPLVPRLIPNLENAIAMSV